MKFGLEDTVINKIQQVFETNPKVDYALLFGSRAKGNHRDGSDIDLALKGQRLTYDDILALGVQLDDLNLPYKTDLLNYATINEPALVEHIDRAGVVFYERWKKVKLRNIVYKLGDGLHGTPKYDINGDYYFINGNNLVDGRIVIKENTQRVSRDEYLKYKKDLNDRTILLGINGTIGNVALYNGEKCVLGKSACYFNVIDSVDKQFIKYVITDKTFQSYIETFANGTTIKNVSLNSLREYEFLLPPFNEQEVIASSLSSLDDKIDLLHRQNKTLEELAETLFKKWFIEDASHEWEAGVLGDVIELLYGKALKEEIRTGSGFPVIGSSGVVGYHDQYLVESPGIVIGRKGTLGKVLYQFENFHPIDTTYFVKSKLNSQGMFYEYFLLKTLNFEEMNSDSAVPGLNRDIALSTIINVPPEKRIKEFNEIIEPMFNKIKTNQFQIVSLTQTRDKMLPKLMTGELKITY